MRTVVTQEEGVASKALASAEKSQDRVEQLRQILTDNQLRRVSYDEAREIGDSLIQFYQLLAEKAPDEPEPTA